MGLFFEMAETVQSIHEAAPALRAAYNAMIDKPIAANKERVQTQWGELFNKIGHWNATYGRNSQHKLELPRHDDLRGYFTKMMPAFWEAHEEGASTAATIERAVNMLVLPYELNFRATNWRREVLATSPELIEAREEHRFRMVELKMATQAFLGNPMKELAERINSAEAALSKAAERVNAEEKKESRRALSLELAREAVAIGEIVPADFYVEPNSALEYLMLRLGEAQATVAMAPPEEPIAIPFAERPAGPRQSKRQGPKASNGRRQNQKPLQPTANGKHPADQRELAAV